MVPLDSPEDSSAEHPEDEFQRLLRQLLSGDAEGLAQASGLPLNPAMLSGLFASVQHAAASGDDIDWSQALTRAQQVAESQQVPLTSEERERAEQAFSISSLWLTEATDFDTSTDWQVVSRREWATATLPFWQRLSEPVAASVSDALLNTLQQNLPDELSASLGQAAGFMRRMASTVFVVQLGQVVGQLASETVSANEIGIPVVPDNTPALLPQNIHDFSEGLEVPDSEITIYLATRELAHVALFRHAPWLTSELTSAITAYASGIHIDVTRIEALGGDIDPTDPSSLKAAIEAGALIPPRTEAQDAALARIENLLTLIEGWVDTVTTQATHRLPKQSAITEAVNRRRAIGGPAEHAFSTLVGLEFRPRQLRRAAALWQAVTDQLGSTARDAIWQHPDLLPQPEDLDDPQAFIARSTQAPTSDFDRDLARLLDGELPEPGDESDAPDA